MLPGKISCCIFTEINLEFWSRPSPLNKSRFLQVYLLVTKIYKNRKMKISLFNYSMLGYISVKTASPPDIYRRNSCPTQIFKPTHRTGLHASSHPGIFQTNLPLFGTFCRFLQPGPGLISSSIFCKKLNFPTINHNRYIKSQNFKIWKIHWAQFPMIE